MNTTNYFAHHTESEQTGLLQVEHTVNTDAQEYYEGMQEARFAGLILLASIALALIFWWILQRLSKQKSSSLPVKKQIWLAHIIIVFILIAEAAGAWDVWWHRAVGRDHLWEIPHLFLYFSASVAIIVGLYCYYRTQQKRWKWIALFLMLIPISAPLDQFWHTLFGVEDLARPISMAWSPAHMMITLSAVLAIAALLPIIRTDTNKNMRIFFSVVAFGTVMAPLQFLFMPFHPTEGWGQVLGFWGTGFFTMPLIGIPLIAKQWIGTRAAATRTMIIGMIFWLIMYGKETAPDILLLPHDRAGNWLTLFATIPAAVWLDLSTRFPLWIRPAIGGAFMSFVLLAFAPPFFAPEFQFPLSSVAIGMFSSFVVGGAFGFLIEKVQWKNLH